MTNLISEQEYFCFQTPNLIYCFPEWNKSSLHTLISFSFKYKEEIKNKIKHNHDYMLDTPSDLILRPYILRPAKKYNAYYIIKDIIPNIDELYHFRAEGFNSGVRLANHYGDMLRIYYTEDDKALMYLQLIKDRVITLNIVDDLK